MCPGSVAGMNSTSRERLLAVARAYAEARGLSLTTVSFQAANDGKILGRIASGRDITTRTYDDMMGWFSDRWPDGARWPAGVDRPVPASCA